MADKVIVKMPTDDRSSSAKARGKAWLRRLDWVDTSVSTGYAFIGDRANFGGTVEVPEGTWFLAYVPDVSGSGTLRGREVTLYRVQAGEVVEIEEWNLDAGKGWASKVRDEIAAHLATPDPEPDHDALRARRTELVKELNEINAILGDVPQAGVEELALRTFSEALATVTTTTMSTDDKEGAERS